MNIKKAFDELANILTRFSPQMAAILYMPVLPPGPNGEPGLQLKADIIDHLGSQIILAQSIDKSQPDRSSTRTPEKESHLRNRSLVAIAIENRAAIEKTLSMIHSKMIAPNNPDARRELLGHTIYSVDLSGLMPMLGGPPARKPMQVPADPDTPKMPLSAFTVTDTHLIFANESVVEQAIRTLSSRAESISSEKWFNKAKSSIPSAVGLAGLQNNAASSELLWSTLRQSAQKNKAVDDNKPNEITIGLTSQSIFPQIMFTRSDGLIDFSLLPEFDAVKKYFGISAFYGISRQDGFFFEFKYLSPEASE